MLQTYNKAHRCGRKYLVSPLGQYLLPHVFAPGYFHQWNLDTIRTVFLYTFRLSSFFFSLFFLPSFLSFVFFPLLTLLRRHCCDLYRVIKIFVDEFRRETKRFIIYSNELRIGTILSSLSPFLSNFLNGWIEEICEIRHKISSSALLQNLFWSNNLLIFQYILLPFPSLVMTPDLSRCGLQIASIPRRT